MYIYWKNIIFQYTPEEIEWYGLTWDEAILKITKKNIIENTPKPLKHEYRSKLIEQLKSGGILPGVEPVNDQMP